MGLWNALTDNKTYNFEQAFGVEDITTSAMNQAIKTWFAMYFDAVENHEEDSCQRLPVAVINKLYKTVFSEYEAAVEHSDFLVGCLANLDKVRKKAMQMALIGGECFIKPVQYREVFRFAVIRRDCMIPLARDDDGRITSVGTAEVTAAGKLNYTLLERRTVDAAGTLTIESKLYRSDNRAVLGNQVPLDSLDKYADMEETVILPDIWNLGMAPLRTPVENMVDGSSDAVSVYAAAVKLIHNININERQLCGEFERGESRIIVAAGMMVMDESGERRELRDNIFTAVDEDPDDVGVNIFSPSLREASYLARKQSYLRSIESLIGLARGTLSEADSVEKTATEILTSKGDYALTIADFQNAWADMLKELLPTCLILGKLYGLCGNETFDQEKNLIVSWGDGILYDRNAVNQEMLSQVQSGILRPEKYLGFYYELPCKTEQELAKIREQYMPEITAMADGE